MSKFGLLIVLSLISYLLLFAFDDPQYYPVGFKEFIEYRDNVDVESLSVKELYELQDQSEQWTLKYREWRHNQSVLEIYGWRFLMLCLFLAFTLGAVARAPNQGIISTFLSYSAIASLLWFAREPMFVKLTLVIAVIHILYRMDKGKQ